MPQILQLGTLALIPYAGQLILEMGLIKTTITLFTQILTGSLLFYMFQQQVVLIPSSCPYFSCYSCPFSL